MELLRTEVDAGPILTKCIRCDKVLTLHFNGGKGSERTCCTLTYLLRAERMVFTVTSNDGGADADSYKLNPTTTRA